MSMTSTVLSVVSVAFNGAVTAGATVHGPVLARLTAMIALSRIGVRKGEWVGDRRNPHQRAPWTRCGFGARPRSGTGLKRRCRERVQLPPEPVLTVQLRLSSNHGHYKV